MNDLLFYSLLTALAYYFLVYLPAQKKATPQPNTISQSTQTEPLPKPSTHQTSPENQEIQELKQQLNQLTHSQTQEQKDLEKVLNQLIKGMDDLNKDLDK